MLLSWQKLLPLDGVKELHVRRLATLKTSESHNRSRWNHQHTFRLCLSWYYEFLGMNYVSQPLIHLLDMLCFGHCSLCLQCSSETGAMWLGVCLAVPRIWVQFPAPTLDGFPVTPTPGALMPHVYIPRYTPHFKIIRIKSLTKAERHSGGSRQHRKRG